MPASLLKFSTTSSAAPENRVSRDRSAPSFGGIWTPQPYPGSRLETVAFRLRAILDEHPSSPVYFKPNPGNAGDALIALAGFALLEQTGRSFRLFRNASEVTQPGAVVLYGGGGQLVRRYDGAASATLRALNKRCARLIVLPSSISGHEQLLSRLGANVTLFARDLRSFEIARDTARSAEVLLSDDLAFGLKVLEINRVRLPSWLDVAMQKLSARLRHPWDAWQLPSPGTYSRVLARLARRPICDVLNAYRLDGESARERVPRDNIDLSREMDLGSQSPSLAFLWACCFLRYLSGFEIVKTDRLHVAIASALLGLQVDLEDNADGKLRSVYEHSFRTGPFRVMLR